MCNSIFVFHKTLKHEKKLIGHLVPDLIHLSYIV